VKSVSIPGRQRSKAERTRAEILAAAERRFAEHGYAGTRLEDLGADVGVGRSAVLYHFKDKQQVYRAVLDDLYGGVLDAVRGALAGPGTIAERTERAVALVVDYVAQRPAAAQIALREAASSDPEIRAEVRARSAPVLELVTTILEEGQRAGVLRPVRPDALHFVSAIAGTLLFYVAALPTFVAELPYDHLSGEQMAGLKRDLLEITRRLLGIGGPRPLPAKESP
jgi:AcrR family transcriptional regulator